MYAIFVVLLAIVCVVQSRSVKSLGTEYSADATIEHKIEKRFVNPSLAAGGFLSSGITKIRTKRSLEECEKLRLCRLHARSNTNFFAAFELYFVNRENARLWDHKAHSLADCSRRFSCYR